MPKPGFTLEQHMDAGQRLKQINRELQSLHKELAIAYPINEFEPSLLRTIRHLNKIRVRLENKLRREHPNIDSIRAYFGPPEDFYYGPLKE